jgi:3-methylfumaryl-CoA hydratase
MSPEPARRLASVVQPERRTEVGDRLPLLWHWAYFPDLAPTGALGPDGHPRRRDPWAERFPRRMAGGGSIRRYAPLVLGTPALRRSELVGARERTGRSGGLVICDWLHTYQQAGATVLEETQTLIYRAPGSEADGGRAVPARAPAPAPGPFEHSDQPWELVRRLEFGPVLLFRFSAVTWNSHRIHYDRPYAMLEEGYGGLLVHGPLLTMLLAQETERVLGEQDAIEFRVQSPVLDTEAVDVFVQELGGGRCQAEARTADGRVAVWVLGTAGEVKDAGNTSSN